jgi:type I restriction enzyme, S subunit
LIECNSPKLRFTEYSDDWKIDTLESIADVKGGKRIPKGHYLSEVNTGHPYITVSDMSNGTVNPTNIKFVPLSAIDTIKNYKIKTSDIFISVAGTLGLIGVVPPELDNANLTENANKLTNLRCDQSYLLQYLQTNKLENLINSVKTTNAQPKLAIYAIKEFLIGIPSLPEQQKIAAFLSAVDTKIQLLQRKKELLEQYKKGVMQKIFSQEIRFKDDQGQDYPDWEEKRIGEIATINMGQSPDSKSYNDDGIGLPLVQGNADIKDRCSNPRRWTSQTTKTCSKGDLLLTVRAPVGYIAKSTHQACIGRGVCSISGYDGNEIDFIYQFFLMYEPKWVRIEQGSTFTAVSGSDIRALKIDVPTENEQRKIASYLGLLDNRLLTLRNQVEGINHFKKGLLQQMFV